MQKQKYGAFRNGGYETEALLLDLTETEKLLRWREEMPYYGKDAEQTPYWIGKRVLDILLSLLGLLILLIPMAVIALVIYLDDPGDIIFRQYRVGRFGKWFKVYKFRTMKRGTPKYLTSAQASSDSLTRVGAFLRRTSIDELPQLVNVLQGTMSLVGPRPLIPMEQEAHLLRIQRGVYQLRPGITGLAQICGRDTLSPEEKVRLDQVYLESFSLWTDIRILLGTIPELLGYGKTADRTFYEACIDDCK